MDKQGLEENMKQFYSSSELYMNKLKTHGLNVYSKYLNKILKHVPKKSKILEIGCGVGQIANFLEKRDYNVTGIDISPLFVKEAKKHGDANFEVMDSTALKYEDQSFDTVISAETLEHIPNPRKALSEMTRVLKKRGLIVLRFPNKVSKLQNFSTKISRKPKFRIVKPNLEKDVAGDDEDLCYLASTSDVIVFLKKRGFKIIYTKPFFWPSALIVARKT
jgi:ubiquinone/menaquinone biosynthesis C-methylase UbiE